MNELIKNLESIQGSQRHHSLFLGFLRTCAETVARVMVELLPAVLQLVRECKEVLKGGLLMKQYYQFMLHEVLDHLEQTDCNIDAFEEDLHKMLMVRAGPGGGGRLTGGVLSRALLSSVLALLFS